MGIYNEGVIVPEPELWETQPELACLNITVPRCLSQIPALLNKTQISM